MIAIVYMEQMSETQATSGLAKRRLDPVPLVLPDLVPKIDMDVDEMLDVVVITDCVIGSEARRQGGCCSSKCTSNRRLILLIKLACDVGVTGHLFGHHCVE